MTRLICRRRLWSPRKLWSCLHLLLRSQARSDHCGMLTSFLGLSHTGLGNAEQAKRAFAKAVVLIRTWSRPLLRYPPQVQQAFGRFALGFGVP